MSQFTTAPPADLANFHQGGGGPPPHVLNKDQVGAIEVRAIVHSETGELVGLTFDTPAGLHPTKREDFFMVAVANSYQGRDEPTRFVFMGQPFMVGEDAFQIVGKFDIAAMRLVPNSPHTSNTPSG